MRRSAVAVGTFDGLHQGHKRLIDRLITIAKKNGLESVVVTLSGPVRAVPGILSTTEEKIELLRQFPLDKVIIIPNTEEITRQPAEVFFEQFIRNKLRTRYFIVGEDFAFGRGRVGNTSWLKKVGAKTGITIKIVKPLFFKNKVISSSRIRALLLEGKVEEAAKLLGRFYHISGMPEHGRRIAREMGYPTVNLSVSATKLLPEGVFAAWAGTGTTLLPALVNIGTRPTFFQEGKRAVEVHIMGFKGAWPRHNTNVYLCKRIRDEKRFPSRDKLKRQIARDYRHAAAYFKNN